MKRDESLAPLSRDHHASLILAQLLKKNAPAYPGLPTTAKEKAAYAIAQFDANIKTHFNKEEEMLAKVKDCHATVSVLSGEILKEHRELAAMFSSLSLTDDLVGTMNTLAVTLRDHIRKEERVLFPMLQEHCSPAQLQEIHELLH